MRYTCVHTDSSLRHTRVAYEMGVESAFARLVTHELNYHTRHIEVEATRLVHDVAVPTGTDHCTHESATPREMQLHIAVVGYAAFRNERPDVLERCQRFLADDRFAIDTNRLWPGRNAGFSELASIVIAAANLDPDKRCIEASRDIWSFAYNAAAVIDDPSDEWRKLVQSTLTAP